MYEIMIKSSVWLVSLKDKKEAGAIHMPRNCSCWLFANKPGGMEIVAVGVKALVQRPTTRALILVSGREEAGDLGNWASIGSVSHAEGGGSFLR